MGFINTYKFPEGFDNGSVHISINENISFIRGNLYKEEESKNIAHCGEIIVSDYGGDDIPKGAFLDVPNDGPMSLTQLQILKSGRLAGQAYVKWPSGINRQTLCTFVVISEADRLINSLDKDEILVRSGFNLGKLNVETGEYIYVGKTDLGPIAAGDNSFHTYLRECSPCLLNIEGVRGINTRRISIFLNGEKFESKTVRFESDSFMPECCGQGLALLDRIAKYRGISAAELIQNARDRYFESHEQLENTRISFITKDKYTPKSYKLSRESILSIKNNSGETDIQPRDTEETLMGRVQSSDIVVITSLKEKGKFVRSRTYNLYLMEEGKDTSERFIISECEKNTILRNTPCMGYIEQDNGKTSINIITTEGVQKIADANIDEIDCSISRTASIIAILKTIGYVDEDILKQVGELFKSSTLDEICNVKD